MGVGERGEPLLSFDQPWGFFFFLKMILVGTSDLSFTGTYRITGCVNASKHRLRVSFFCFLSQFFPNGHAIITGSDDCSCKMYDLRSDQEVLNYQDNSLNAGVTSLALSNSGRLIFAGYDDFNCHIWDSLKGEKVGEWSLNPALFS